METLLAVYAFIIGLFMGSFYNVVAMRTCKNESIVFPGSHCVNCNHKLAWYELIPVFSYLGLRGRCKECKKPISIQYPLVELLTAFLFAFSVIIFGLSLNTIIAIILSSIVIITLITDFKYMIILDEVLIIGGILIVLTYIIGEGFEKFIPHLIGGVFLFLVMFLVRVIGNKAFKTESLGWGDIKLSALAGLVLGPLLGIVYIFLGSALALPYALYLSIKNKDNVLPFGPFLCLSLLILFANQDLVLNILNKLLGV